MATKVTTACFLSLGELGSRWHKKGMYESWVMEGAVVLENKN